MATEKAAKAMDDFGKEMKEVKNMPISLNPFNDPKQTAKVADKQAELMKHTTA